MTPQSSPVFAPTTPFVLASPHETLIAHGAVRVLSGQRVGLADEVGALLSARADDGDAPVLVGALPFDSTQAAHLFEPQTIVLTRRAAGSKTRLVEPVPVATGADELESQASRRSYERAVAKALARMATTTDGPLLQKVVLARRLVIDRTTPPDPAAVLRRLRTDPSITAFSVALPETAAGWRVLVGASPELLVKREGLQVTSVPLAGSARRHARPLLDRQAADQLLASDKDHREHAAVVEWIADRLAPFCRRLTVPRHPHLTATASMWHLASHIQGELRDPAVSSAVLAAVLHPTPAVCGVPTELAKATIREFESFDRGFFTGAVGWCAANGDGVWMVAIRCAQLSATTAELFAGAGIVPGSTPEAEADETAAKFVTMLRALSVDEQDVALAETTR